MADKKPPYDNGFRFTPSKHVPPEVDKARLRAFCEGDGLMEVYYDCYPAERPPGYGEPPRPQSKSRGR